MPAEAIEFFERHIRPLFAQKCLECHGPEAKGGLRLDSRASMLRGGDSGAAIAPGDPQASRLIQAVHYESEPKMPPDEKLPAEAVGALEAWVKMGAPWPADSPAAAAGRRSAGLEVALGLPAIKKPPLPSVNATEQPRSPVDLFVWLKLAQQGLAPSPSADRLTLIRRASFDLIGLPPTAEEVDQFTGDPSPAAFAALVERLLASPHFGERWARHWLDVARYADTKGYLFTQDRSYPNAYRYRDWVVRALNEDLPYDEFLIEQIAADRLPSDGRRRTWAAGGDGLSDRRPSLLGKSARHHRRSADVLARGTMALTVTCARCHDHKYDPIPTRDYYALYGVLASSTEPAEPSDLMTLADAARPIVPYVFVRGNPGNVGRAGAAPIPLGAGW